MGQVDTRQTALEMSREAGVGQYHGFSAGGWLKSTGRWISGRHLVLYELPQGAVLSGITLERQALSGHLLADK